MSYIRKETFSDFPKEQLLQMVKECLNELDIPYEEKPGGFGVERLIDPDVFESMDLETFTLEACSPWETAYDPQGSLPNRSVLPGFPGFPDFPDYAWDKDVEEQVSLAAA